MAGTVRLDSELLRAAKQAILKTVINEGYPAILGRSDGTVTYTDPSGNIHNDRAWARVSTEGITTELIARCITVSHTIGLPVKIANREGTPTVIGLDTARALIYTGGNNPAIGFHAWQHGRLGPDPLYITGPTFIPLMAVPSSPLAMTVTVETGFYRYEGVEKVWEQGNSADLTAFIPASDLNQHFIILCLNRSTNALVVVDGVDKLALGVNPFTVTDVNAISIDNAFYPIAAIRFYNGQTTILAQDIFMDLRLWGGESLGPGGANFDVIMTDDLGGVMVDALGNVMVES